MKVVFVTPAYDRTHVSRVVFAQRERACKELRRNGHEATAVIVADDDNVRLARKHGFQVVRAPNHPLGHKWNLGYQAARDLGADFVMPIGSDSLLDPALVLAWLERKRRPEDILFTVNYSVVHRSGKRRLDCVVTKGGGGGMLIPAALMRRAHWRPVEEKIERGCDNSTLRSIGGKLRVHNLHPWAIVALQSNQQITSYDGLSRRWAVNEAAHEDVLAPIREHYGLELAREVGALYRPKVRA